MNLENNERKTMVTVIRKKITIPIRNEEHVSAVITNSKAFRPGKGTAVILAHGAGNDMHHPLLGVISQVLAEAGYLALRFNFLYREKGKKSPDTQTTLETTWEKVYRYLSKHPRYQPATILAAGKSLGCRVASQMVSEGALPVQGMVLLGYPLHPPGKPERLRDSHLYNISVPMLFFVGTRDPLCRLQSMLLVLDKLRAPWDMETIDGGNHSFQISKSKNMANVEVYDRIASRTVSWINETF